MLLRKYSRYDRYPGEKANKPGAEKYQLDRPELLILDLLYLGDLLHLTAKQEHKQSRTQRCFLISQVCGLRIS